MFSIRMAILWLGASVSLTACLPSKGGASHVLAGPESDPRPLAVTLNASAVQLLQAEAGTVELAIGDYFHWVAGGGRTTGLNIPKFSYGNIERLDNTGGFYCQLTAHTDSGAYPTAALVAGTVLHFALFPPVTAVRGTFLAQNGNAEWAMTCANYGSGSDQDATLANVVRAFGTYASVVEESN